MPPHSHLLLTGATGFLGQALLERVLTSYPETRVTLLIRGRGSASAGDRLTKLLRRPVFATWRERVGEEQAAKIVADRVTVLDAELGSAELALPGDLTAAIHAASTVSFDPPIDDAFRTNVQGVVDLYQAIRQLDQPPHVVHVSTAYVAGTRRGSVPEESLDHQVAWRTELAAASGARDRVEQDSRRPEVLRRALATARREHGKAGPQSTAAAAEQWRREWVDRQLIEYGRLRAQTLGWPDVYTLTKALGERAAEELLTGVAPLSVVRPAIVESALRHPYPGWIDGFKMADPLIIAFGRGVLPEFPGLPDGVLDVIPVDLVVNATIAAAAAPPPVAEPAYYHVGSGARNPLTFRAMYDNVREYFTDHPMPDGGRGQIKVPTWDFPGARRVGRMLRTGERVLTAAQRTLLATPAGQRTRRWQDDLTRERDKLDFLRRYADLYGVYTEAEVLYSDSRLLALHRALPPDRIDEHGFDAAAIDWPHYLQQVHCPAITATVRRATAGRPGTAASAPPVAGNGGRPDADRVAIFDLEGTLVASNVIETYLLARLADTPRGDWLAELADLARGLPRYFAAERRDRGEFLRTFLRRYADADEAALHRLVADRLGGALLRRAYPQALRRVRQHRAAGHRTVLITGTIDVLVQPLAPLFDEVVASRLHTRDGRYSGFLESPPLVGEARAAWLRRYAQTAGVSLTDSYAYGDSYSDRPLLAAVGNPVAVNPDPQLYRHARRHRWAVAEWTSHTLPAAETFAETVA
ncbi:HAD-IB family hydrolase [Natronosporangium hydrolyticum]|uniref:HAD-IB family hydrolase n=1 Tax=Natronosporangium hydrolyticum TaxID=2811111 RepID=A0A895YGY7_9ACTN|nr:HAD-IB family hydrolase [Natronosporangium hydrolyticum]QSB14779.1 HAD-IB family hydrolase [Natronosporangium hydrolyticum]